MTTGTRTLSESLSISQGLKIANAIFLVAGACIGGGMLALPISSGPSGFWPSVFLMFVCCAFMTVTGLLFLEATLWMKKDSHLISLSKEFLNKGGQAVCWAVYLFIGYASLTAYTSGGGKELSFIFKELFNFSLSNSLSGVVFLLIFGSIIYLGYRTIERVNATLFIGMMAAYAMMIGLAPKEINFHLLERHDLSATRLFSVMPLMLTTFSFPGIVPTIVPYLNREVKAVRIAIAGGTSLSFIVYFIWLLIVFGTVPNEGPHGLQEALRLDTPATECLHYAIKSPLLSCVSQFFAFFALTTSFLGIGLAFFDFLCDGLGISKIGSKKIGVVLLIAVPVLFFALYFQRAFTTALELTGGIGDSIISGLIPAIMVWKGRYRLFKKGSYQVSGGKPLLIGVCLFSLFILTCELVARFVM